MGDMRELRAKQVRMEKCIVVRKDGLRWDAEC